MKVYCKYLYEMCKQLPFLVMDEVVRNLLHECGLSNCIERFKDDEIDEESLYCLSNEEIKELIPKKGPRAKFRNKLMLLMKEKNRTNQESVDSSAENEQEHEEAANSSLVEPSTSDTSDKRKRMSDLQGEPSQCQSPKRRRDAIPGSYEESRILFYVKSIMGCVQKRLPNHDNEKLSAFLRTEISDLETDKRELVGVFGKTGAGKSSLINAIIGEKNLLPSGSIDACTSVMIKVEANGLNLKYEADIEFITKEEWKDELWSFLNFHGDNPNQEEDQSLDDDYQDSVEKMSALYGEEWRNISPENLLDNKYFREISEFIHSRRKTLTCESAKELSAKLVKYTRSDSKDGDGKGITRWYWPLVKCVTVRVPNNVLLQYVTLVDLPGTNDRNKSRDVMWKGLVGSCSTVWIVTDTNRAAAEKEPWEILESASSCIGNGGQCQQIHFICTKSDLMGDLDDGSTDGVRAQILKTNIRAKEAVRKEFNKLTKIKKHFSDDSFKVFTVSSKEFLKKKHLNADETEIPELQEFLQNLNDCHSETLNYVSGAQGILSLIQGARCTGVAEQKTKVCAELEEKMRLELERIRKPMIEAYEAFKKRLSEGVEKSKGSCEKDLHSVLYPRMIGGAFHKILKSVVKYGGTYKPKKGKLIQLNLKLASCLTDSIDEEFKKTFPNEGKSGPFSGIIETFSLDTERLTEKYKDVKLQLTFLKTEEEKIKIKLNKIIRNRKKTIYSSLTESIEENMQECYEKAAEFRGKDTLKNMRATLEEHVHESKNTMFEEARRVMLRKLNELMEEILRTLKETMQKSIELSLLTDGDSIPDFTWELEAVKKYHSELVGSPEEETPVCIDPPGPAAALSL